MKVYIISILIATFILRTEAEWHKVWEDEFDGNTLNASEWVVKDDCIVYNNELECYSARPQNVKVENGHLVIHAYPEEYKGKKFSSGLLNSKKSWAFGKFEARAKLPKGRHLWPAIWMMPAQSVYGGWAASGEIDIMEYIGQRPDQILGTIHYGGVSPNKISHGSESVKFDFDFSADFHTFGLEWEAKELRWYCDGKEYHKENIDKSMWSGMGTNPYTKNGQPFDQPFYWILNVAVGGAMFPEQWFGPQVTPEEAKSWPKPTMEIDYVRVWQWK